MSLDNLSKNDQVKLTQFMDQGVAALQEITDLKEGLADTAKSIADDIGTTPDVLKSALTAAFKSSLAKQRDKMDAVETVLQLTGRA